MDKEQFKKLISYLETSGGKDLEHPEMTSGMHEGTKAMGEYGMMPITAQQMAKNRLKAGKGTELDKIVEKTDPSQVEDVLGSNPDKYNQYVNDMSDKVMDKSQGNPEEAAMRWYAGPNSSESRLKNIADKSTGRTDKIQDFLNQDAGSSAPQSFTDKLMEDTPPKEILYNKIRSKLGL